MCGCPIGRKSVKRCLPKAVTFFELNASTTSGISNGTGVAPMVFPSQWVNHRWLNTNRNPGEIRRTLGKLSVITNALPSIFSPLVKGEPSLGHDFSDQGSCVVIQNKVDLLRGVPEEGRSKTSNSGMWKFIADSVPPYTWMSDAMTFFKHSCSPPFAPPQ